MWHHTTCPSGHTFVPSYTTLFNKIFLGRQLRQGVKVLQHFMDWLCPHLQGFADGLVKPKQITRCTTACCEYLCTGWAQEVHTTHNRTHSYQFWFYQAISNTLQMVMESVPEMMENFHTLMRPYGWENFIEFCRRRSFKTYIQHYTPKTVFLKVTAVRTSILYINSKMYVAQYLGHKWNTTHTFTLTVTHITQHE